MTNAEEVIDHSKNLLVESFEVDPAAVTPEATLADLELDSLSVVEFYVALGEHYDVALSDSDPNSETVPLAEIAGKVTTLLHQRG